MLTNYYYAHIGEPNPVATWSKACICDRWLAGIVGSNPAAGMHGCLLCVVCCQLKVAASG